jgi:pyrimidine deaminase RibD-like protein
MPEEPQADRYFMELAIAEAKKSTPTKKGDPIVGAIVTRDVGDGKGVLIATGRRERDADTNKAVHAEIAALNKISKEVARGTTVFTTLEPCISRRETNPCCDFILSHGVDRVVIGILNPNRDIRGQGEWLLEDRRIKIGKFDPDLVQEIRRINNDFIEYELGPGIKIDHPLANQAVAPGKLELSGTFRTHPRSDDHICAFTREGTKYYPQAPVNWNKETQTWNCSAAVGGPGQYELMVARISDDLEILRLYYSRVHDVVSLELMKQTDYSTPVQALAKAAAVSGALGQTAVAGPSDSRAWIGFEMSTLPPGFEVLHSVSVKCQ